MKDKSAIIIPDWKKAQKGEIEGCDNFGLPIEINECIERYKWAKKNIVKGKTLDAPCGNGYGTSILSGKNKDTIGLDIDPDKIEACQGFYPKCEYIQGNMLNTVFSDNEFKNVVAIEGIEHLPDVEAYLIEVERILAKNGRFICSTANVEMHGMGHPKSKHLHAWNRDQFVAILSRHFEVMKVEPIDCGRGITSWIVKCKKNGKGSSD